MDTREAFATQDSGTELLTLTWDEGSPLLFPHRTRHSVEATFDYSSPPGAFGDGGWTYRADDRVAGATQRGRELWFAWSEGRSICLDRCDGPHPGVEKLWSQPHVHIVVLDTRSLRLVRERFIYNPQYAIAYPTLATNSLGQVAMTFSYGGGTAGNASPAGGYLTEGESFRQVATSPDAGDQGDYFSLTPEGKRFTAAGYVSAADANGNVIPRWLFYRFGRSG